MAENKYNDDDFIINEDNYTEPASFAYRDW